MYARKTDDETDHGDCLGMKHSVNSKNDEVREVDRQVENGDG